jgi:hypothetical protein
MKLRAELRAGEWLDGMCLFDANHFAPCQNAGANNAEKGNITWRPVQ